MGLLFDRQPTRTMTTETIQPDTAMPTVRIMPAANVGTMRIKSAEVMLSCATCAQTINDHADLLFHVDADDFERDLRANSKWATDNDPEGLTCLDCQAANAAETKAQQERM